MIDDLQWDIDKIHKREQMLSHHLADVLDRISAALLSRKPRKWGCCWLGVCVNSKGYKVYEAGSSLYGGTITINACKFEEMNAELDENKELGGNHLNELEELRPVNQKMHLFISSLQNHNHQLKGEVLRYKRKLREAQSDLSKEGPGEPEGDETVARYVCSAPKEQRDKVHLMAAEKAKAELEELRQRVKELEDKAKKESKRWLMRMPSTGSEQWRNRLNTYRRNLPWPNQHAICFNVVTALAAVASGINMDVNTVLAWDQNFRIFSVCTVQLMYGTFSE
ncbi:hypothetical protein DUI87_30688 [Hirundo rustica rustica]|uniref:E3 ubiquitin protein ligase n=1 Tax=Hirundo rustica rustica TaxID=333673 RepID=A0A3M0IVC5_HIRRU|nr:hypothetical protein DUI87_30688 [Hirundo rustica rustica]